VLLVVVRVCWHLLHSPVKHPPFFAQLLEAVDPLLHRAVRGSPVEEQERLRDDDHEEHTHNELASHRKSAPAVIAQPT
jgi:hypothetical protein